MLEVGVTGQNGHSEGGLSYVEQRTHFGLCTPHFLGALQPLLADTQTVVSRSFAGCVTSSPLTLSFDLGNSTATDAAWSIITNTDALAVSQSYYGMKSLV